VSASLAPLLAFLLLHFLTGLLVPLYAGAAPPLFALSKGAAAWLDRRLNRRNRKKRVLALRGAVVALLFVTATSGLGRLTDSAVAQPQPYSWIVQIAALFLCAGLMQPLNILREIARDLKAKRAAGTLLRPHIALPEKADSHTVARRAVEWSALTLDIWFMGPLFWFALGGVRGAVLYTVIAGLCAAVAPEDENHKFFGLTARWIGAVLNLIPSALAALLIAFAATFVSKASPARALIHAFKSRIGAWPVGAMAGALGVTLSGPPHGWIGPKDSSARLTPGDVERCALLHFVFFLCVMAFASAGILATHFFHILK
jgi:adenosylcobinamide-phosphate synthase